MTSNSNLKRAVRARMAEKGIKYTQALREVQREREDRELARQDRTVDQIVSDMIADDEITPPDAEAVLTFSQYLHEVPMGMVTTKGADWPSYFKDRPAFEAWRTKWLPYMAGLASGPSTPEEWPKYRERIKELRR